METLVAPIKASPCHPRKKGRWQAKPDMTAAEIGRGQPELGSPANRGLHAIIRQIADLQDQIETWLEQHGPGCHCCYCSGRHYGEDDPTPRGRLAAEELQSLHWLLGRTFASTDLALTTPEDLARLLKR